MSGGWLYTFRFLGLSLAVHLALLILLWRVGGPELIELKEKRVILEFLEERPRDWTGPEPASPARSFPQESGAALGLPPVLSEELQEPEEFSYKVPGRAQTEFREEPRLPDAGVAPIPAPEVILDQLRSEGSVEPGRSGKSQVLESAEMSWEGTVRRLLESGKLEFPEVLLLAGQEVDVEASFMVLPSGRVTDIEIIRSSGYTLVDRAVEYALADYRFEPSALGKKDRGRIRFLFRLQRADH